MIDGCRKHTVTPVRLSDLEPGRYGVVRDIRAEDTVRRRLMDLGIIEGARIEMIRPAPLGDPLQIKVHGALVALRKREADTLLIEPGGEHEYGPKRHRHRVGRKSKQR